MYCKVNDDLICLRKNLTSEVIPADQIMRDFFRRDSDTRFYAKVRLLLNVVIKILYTCASFISFLSLDQVLNGEYARYGKTFIDWSQLHSTRMHDYLGLRNFPKPGNKLLPPFGYCEFFESAKDVKQTKTNKFKIICELSQHIMYQYCLLVMWFCLVIGMGVSVLGIIHLLWTYLSNFLLTRCHFSY